MEKEMKMKEVKNELMNEKVFYEMKFGGERVLRFVKKDKMVCYEVINESKREDGLRVLKKFLEKGEEESASGSQTIPEAIACGANEGRNEHSSAA